MALIVIRIEVADCFYRHGDRCPIVEVAGVERCQCPISTEPCKMRILRKRSDLGDEFKVAVEHQML